MKTQGQKIEITTHHAASSYGQPVCLIDGQLVDDKDGLLACLDALGWDRNVFADKIGKSWRSADAYRYGTMPVPAEVWNVLKDALEARA